MLQLDSAYWSELTHAYGKATDVPSALTKLASGDDEALGQLFGSVCHQGSVYSASFAVFPHLLRIAEEASAADIRADILALAGAIATSKDNRCDKPLRADIKSEYESSLSRALNLMLATLQEPIEPATAVYVLQAAAGLKGFVALEHVLSGFVDEEFCIQCPNCESELYIWPSDVGLTIAAEDPVRSPETPRTAVQPGPLQGSPHANAYHWLIEVGGGAALSKIGHRLAHLFGLGRCPSCAQEFSLLEELVSAA
jgi:hypothetical protein